MAKDYGVGKASKGRSYARYDEGMAQDPIKESGNPGNSVGRPKRQLNIDILHDQKHSARLPRKA